MSQQIYKITYNGKTSLVQAKNPNEAIMHVFRPHVQRLNAVQAREAEKAGIVLELAGECTPLNQPDLPLAPATGEPS